MTYTKQEWIDQQTVVSAARMDHIESGVEAAHGLADDLDTRLTATEGDLDTRLTAAEGAIDALEPGEWADLPLTSPWSAYDPAGNSYYPGMRARRVPAGVQFQGMVRGGDANSEICSLPSGLAPQYGGHFAAISNGQPATVFVSKSGQIRYLSGGSSTAYVSINLVVPVPVS